MMKNFKMIPVTRLMRSTHLLRRPEIEQLYTMFWYQNPNLSLQVASSVQPLKIVFCAMPLNGDET